MVKRALSMLGREWQGSRKMMRIITGFNSREYHGIASSYAKATEDRSAFAESYGGTGGSSKALNPEY